MAGTRSSARLASQQKIAPSSTPAKRKSVAEDSATSSSKRGKKKGEKEQTTLDDVVMTDEPAQEEPPANGEDTSKVEDEDKQDVTESKNDELESKEDIAQSKDDEPKAEAHGAVAAGDSKIEESKPEERQPTSTEESKDDNKAASKDTTTADETSASKPQEEHHQTTTSSNGTAVDPKARENETPSSILEKGIIYFFFRARVGVDDPQDTNDIARSYLVLRPLPHGAKLTDGPIGDDNNCRLIALPKKVLPQSGKDRFMSFVEKARISFKELKDDFLTASDYSTKTVGQRHSPSATPVAEGIYALTTTGRESHLAYMVTIPSEIGEVQKDIGLKEKGAFVTSVKNPKYPGPANANIGKDPGYPQEIMDEFRDLRWTALGPKFLDYPNAQLLLIGESGGIEAATEQLPRDERNDKETPLEEMEKLEGEDEIRVKHLHGDDAIFADLGASAKDFPKVLTTW